MPHGLGDRGSRAEPDLGPVRHSRPVRSAKAATSAQQRAENLIAYLRASLLRIVPFARRQVNHCRAY